MSFAQTTTKMYPTGAFEAGDWNDGADDDAVRSYRVFAEGDDQTWARAYGMQYSDGASSPLSISLGARSDVSYRSVEEHLDLTVTEARKLHAQLGRVLRVVEAATPCNVKAIAVCPLCDSEGVLSDPDGVDPFMCDHTA